MADVSVVQSSNGNQNVGVDVSNATITTINGKEVCLLETNQSGQLLITQPLENVIQNIDLAPQQSYVLNIDPQNVQSATAKDGDYIVSFNDGSAIVLRDFAAAMADEVNGPTIALANGQVIGADGLVASLLQVTQPEESLLEEPQIEIRESSIIAISQDEVASVDQDIAASEIASIAPAAGDEGTAFLSPEDLAAIAPEAGPAAAAAGATSSGFGFGSAFTPTGVVPLSAIGPIPETALTFGLNQPTQDPLLLLAVTPLTFDPAVEFDNAFVVEDQSVQLQIEADPELADSTMVVSISGIPSDWTVTGPGVYDAVTGTWSITTTGGTPFSGGPIFQTGPNTDVDLASLTLTVSETDIGSGFVSTVTNAISVFVDAEADAPNLSANDASGIEDNPVALDIQTSLNDTDGSEEITQVVISDVPSGFSFTDVSGNPIGTDLGSGQFSFTQAQLSGLQIVAPANFSGSVNLTVTSFVEEVNLAGDSETDLTNNTAQSVDTLTVNWLAVPDQPTLVVADGEVKEDGTVFIPVTSNLVDTDGSEFLTIQVTDIPAGTTFSGTGFTEISPGVWQITVPAGQNYADGFSLTPPADSDIDLNDILITAISTEISNGTTASNDTTIDVIVDAVADQADIIADNETTTEGQAIAIDLQGFTGEANNATPGDDGSETITGYQISGVPNGFTFSAGTDLGGGVWSFTPADIVGLTLNPNDPTFNGTLNLTASVFTQDGPTDGEFDTTDNTSTDSDAFSLTWTPVINPPTIAVNGGVDDAVVKEDGTVDVTLVAQRGANPDPAEFLTVTVTGIDSAWGFSAPVGSYNPTTGTWTYQVPAGQDLSTLLTFTPPADSDIDLTGLRATVTSTDGSQTAGPVNDDFNIIVDAVADQADVDAGDVTGSEGNAIVLNITGDTGEALNATPGDDGSERIVRFEILDVPAGFSFNGAGSDQGSGVWYFTEAEINNLQIVPPSATYNGSLSLRARIVTTENPVSDGEADTSDNVSTDIDGFTVTWNSVLTPPTVTVNPPGTPGNPYGTGVGAGARVKEDGSVDVEVNADFGPGAAATEQLTVTVTGIDSAWGFSAPVGSYNAANGTWTYTGPIGQEITQLLTFTPPADSDIDLTGLRAAVSVTDTANNQTANGTPQDFDIITDAVADQADVDAGDVTGSEGNAIALNITGSTGEANNATPGDDGSEVIVRYEISGVPSGFTFNGAGSDQGTGTWYFTAAEIAGLQIVPPNSTYNGSLSLQARIVTSENPVSDGEFDGSDNTSTDLDGFTVTWSPQIDPPTITVNGGVDDAVVKEDGIVDVTLVAQLGPNADAAEFLTVTVTGIDSAWGFSVPVGSYNPTTGTWTYQVPAGQNLSTLLSFAPPADSDIDLSGMRASVTATDPNTSQTAGPVNDDFNIIVDAVIDGPDVEADDVSGAEGNAIILNISGDTGEALNGVAGDDGSERIVRFEVLDVPAGFSFNGAGSDQGSGVWYFTEAEINNLQIVPPSATYNGSLSLRARIVTTENPVSDGEADTSDNTATDLDAFTVTWNGTITPPTVTVNPPGTPGNPYGTGVGAGARVKEDGSIDVEVNADFGPNAAPTEQLTITITGIDNGWGFSAPVGSYNSSTATWTYTGPVGQDITQLLTFTPPADSDIDLSGLRATVSVTDTANNQSASGSPQDFDIIVDAVIDGPDVNAQNTTSGEGQPIAVNLSGSTGEANNGTPGDDSSERIVRYEVNGVPSGFTFNAGSDQGGGVWYFTPSEIAGLTLTPNSATFNGSLTLTARIRTTENPVGDGEFDNSDNTAIATDSFTLTWSPQIDPPTIAVNGGVDDVVVKEDGTVDVTLVAQRGANADPAEFLTVTVTGIDSAWGFSAPVGSYNAANGTWTYQVPAGQDLSTLLTFTPPADSDIDLSGLRASVTATDPNTSQTAGPVNDDFNIIVDAVIDGADINAQNVNGSEGSSIALNISGNTGEAVNATPGDDGSEVIARYEITGVPSGFGFNGAGSDQGSGVWYFTEAEISNLQIVPPSNTFNGSVTLTARIVTTENPASDAEPDTSDNTDTDTQSFTVNWSSTINPPTISVEDPTDPNNNPLGTTTATGGRVKEDGSVEIEVNAGFGAGAAPTEQLTVTLSGIDSNWGFSAPVGTYNQSAGTWTYTGPVGQVISQLVTFTPSADSDIDLTGLQASVSVTDTANGDTANGSPQDFAIIVDAVADQAVITAANRSADEGQPIALNISGNTGEATNATPGNDGSEVIVRYEISGVPDGFSFNGGTNQGGGVWFFTQAEISGLTVTPPNTGYFGSVTLNARVITSENPVSDGEYDGTDNTSAANDSFTLTWNELDDQPIILNTDRLDVDETDFDQTPLDRDTDSGQIVADFGVDGPGPNPYTLTTAPTFSGLTSNGNSVTVSLSGNKYIGLANGQPVFELNVDRQTGAYTFTLLANLDHPNVNNPNDIIQLGFGVRVTDADGDFVDGTIQVRVFDDGPVAQDDFATLAQGDTVQSGDVSDNDDSGEDGDDDGTVTQISFNGNDVDLTAGSATINGQYGTLQINEDGTYTYTKTVNNASDVTDVFTYTLADGDGDTVTADLSLTSIGTPLPPPGLLIVGTNANDLSGSSTPWEVGNGSGVINGSAGEDILVGDTGGDCDVTVTPDYNLLFILDTSSSMGANGNFDTMIEAVVDQLRDIAVFYDGDVKVRIQTFGTDAGNAATFDLNNVIDYSSVSNYLEALTTGGFTNYEAGLQEGIDWLQSNELIPNAITQTYFMSDGAPNRYLNNAGNPASAGGDVQRVINEITGSDGSNEVAQIQALSDEVISVGINSGVDQALSVIDSDGTYADINDSDQFVIPLGNQTITKLLAPGCDEINGGASNDIIFGDVLFTDDLAAAQGLSTRPGAGWEVFAELEAGNGNNAGWTRADTIDYITNNAAALSQESVDAQGDSRGYNVPFAGHDVLNGGAGEDLIFGQEGNDLITGGEGDDTLVGGSGNDSFIYEGNDGVDTILDFESGDVLDISALLNGFDPLQDSINNFVFKTEVNGDTVVSVDANGTGNQSNAVQIAVLDGVTGINIIDIVNNGQSST